MLQFTLYYGILIQVIKCPLTVEFCPGKITWRVAFCDMSMPATTQYEKKVSLSAAQNLRAVLVYINIYIFLTQFGVLVFLLCKDKEHKYFRKALKIYHYDITYGI